MIASGLCVYQVFHNIIHNISSVVETEFSSNLIDSKTIKIVIVYAFPIDEEDVSNKIIIRKAVVTVRNLS